MNLVNSAGLDNIASFICLARNFSFFLNCIFPAVFKFSSISVLFNHFGSENWALTKFSCLIQLEHLDISKS